MIFLNNIFAESDRIKESIKKYGYAPEHNFWCYACEEESDLKAVFAESKDGSGLLTLEEENKKICYVFSSPVAPPSYRIEVIIEYLNFIFETKEVKKIGFELEQGLYENLIKALPDKFKARRIIDTLIWPVHDLKIFDEKLSGGEWKKLRKLNNKLYREHTIEIADAKTYGNKDALHNLIKECEEKRAAGDRAYFSSYHEFVEKNFEGTDEARIFIIDGKACGINAGWMIPNSNTFYGAIMLHNYSISGLGEALCLENLLFLKSHGYNQVNTGGGDKESVKFKNRFHPQYSYKTYYFYIVRK